MFVLIVPHVSLCDLIDPCILQPEVIGGHRCFSGAVSDLRGSVLSKHFRAQGQKKCPLVAPLAHDTTIAVSGLISTFSPVINGDPGLASGDLRRQLATLPYLFGSSKRWGF